MTSGGADGPDVPEGVPFSEPSEGDGVNEQDLIEELEAQFEDAESERAEDTAISTDLSVEDLVAGLEQVTTTWP